jgi:hypothetical protein
MLPGMLAQKYMDRSGIKENQSQNLKNITALFGLGEAAEKVSAHLEPFHGCWKLSRLFLPSVLFPTLN